MDLVKRALVEDGAFRDITSAIIPNTKRSGIFLAKQDLVVCGMDVARRTFRMVGVAFAPKVRDAVATLMDEEQTTWWDARRRMAEGTTPDPVGPPVAAWRRVWEQSAPLEVDADTRLRAWRH